MSSYIKEYYPDIEIISVNPVGLRGLFDNEVLIITKFNIVKYFNTKKWL